MRLYLARARGAVQENRPPSPALAVEFLVSFGVALFKGPALGVALFRGLLPCGEHAPMLLNLPGRVPSSLSIRVLNISRLLDDGFLVSKRFWPMQLSCFSFSLGRGQTNHFASSLWMLEVCHGWSQRQ